MAKIRPASGKTIRERKKAQPKAVQFLSEAERQTIRNTVAKNLTDPQYSVFIYTCQALGLNPLLNEITAISYAGNMSIQVMRDGFLTIAHRSGKFAGLESGIYDQGTKRPDGTEPHSLTGWAKVYHKDFQVPVYQEAEFDEYSTGKNLWLSKPKTMIKKVAESMALRKAFNVNGVYAPEEMEKEIQTTEVSVPQIEDPTAPATPAQISTMKSLGYKWTEEDPMTKQEAVEWIQNATRKAIKK